MLPAPAEVDLVSMPRLGPNDSEEVLGLLVECVLEADRLDAARVPLYQALFSFLLYLSPPRVTSGALTAILEGRRAGAGGLAAASDAVSRADAAQGKVEESLQRVLQQHGRALAAQLATDAAEGQWPDIYRALVLRLLGCLASLDGTGAFAAQVASGPLPRSILAGLAPQAMGIVHASPVDASRSLAALEAGLGLLLAMVQSGAGRPEGKEMARLLFDRRALQLLAAVKAIDLHLEDSLGAGSVAAVADSGMALSADGKSGPGLRERVNRVLTPCLRLAVSVALALPDSDKVSSEVLDLLESHTRPFARVLREVGEARGPVGWDHGLEEVEQAGLLVALVGRLPHADLMAQRLPQLQFAVLALAQEMVCRNSTSSNRYILALEEGRKTASASASDADLAADRLRRLRLDRLDEAVRSLRCSLSQLVRQQVLDGRLVLPCATDLKSPEARPSLVQLVSLVEQAAVEVDPMAAEQQQCIEALRSKDSRQAQALVEQHGAAPAELLGRLDPESRRRVEEKVLSRMERARERALRSLLFIIENSLAAIYHHMDRALGAAATTNGAMSSTSLHQGKMQRCLIVHAPLRQGH